MEGKRQRRREEEEERTHIRLEECRQVRKGRIQTEKERGNGYDRWENMGRGESTTDVEE